MTLEVTGDKMINIDKLCLQILLEDKTSLRFLSYMTRKFVATFLALLLFRPRLSCLHKRTFNRLGITDRKIALGDMKRENKMIHLNVLEM